MTAHPPPAEHLSAETLAAYVDGGLGREERRDADAHLADCAECARELAAVAALADAPAAARRRPSGRAAAFLTLAAAAAALLVVRLPRPGEGRPEADALRAAATEATEGVRAVRATAPAAGDTVRAAALAFAWEPLGGEVTYQVTLSDARGARVWDTTTAAARAALPETVGRTLRAGDAYYWRVDALLDDLGSATSGERRVVVAP